MAEELKIKTAKAEKAPKLADPVAASMDKGNPDNDPKGPGPGR